MTLGATGVRAPSLQLTPQLAAAEESAGSSPAHLGGRGRGKQVSEVEASLVYIASSRTAGAVRQRSSASNPCPNRNPKEDWLLILLNLIS